MSFSSVDPQMRREQFDDCWRIVGKIAMNESILMPGHGESGGFKLAADLW